MAVQVLVDTVQARVSQQSVSTLVTGQDWDLTVTSSDLYVDPATWTLMCRPGAFYPSWLTSNSGIFTKLPLSSFTTTPGTFYQQAVNSDNAPFYYLSDNASGNAYGTTTSSLSANQPMVAEWYQEPTTPNPDDAVWFGWGANPTSPAAGDVAVKFYYNGEAEVYKSGTFVGRYTMSGENKTRFNRNIPAQGKNEAAKYVTVVMIPCRGRELLVLSSEGTGFTHVFDDIPEGTASPTITPATPFFFYVSSPTSVAVRCAVCQFSSGGTAYGTASKWRYDPGASPAGGFQTWADYDGAAPTLSVVDAVTLGAYANNTNGVRVAVTLTGGTQFVYGARAYTLPVYANTIGGGGGGTGVDITQFVTELSLTMGDSNGGTQGRLVLRDPLKAAGAGAPNLWLINNRPVQIWDGGHCIFDGVLILPQVKEGVVFDPASTVGGTTYGSGLGSNPIEEVSFELRDLFYAAERYRQKEPVPLDGMTLQNGFITTAGEFWDLAALLGGYRVSAFGGFTLDHSGNVTTSEFNVVNKPTETGAEEISKLHQTFVANAFVGYDPVYGLQISAQGDMPTAPVATLYDGDAAWVAAGHMSGTETPKDICRTLDVKIVPIEANDVYVCGWDYRYERPIIAHKADAASQNPTTIPSSRPANWTGDVLSYSFETDHITTQATATAACELMFSRLDTLRALLEFETDYQYLLQRGQVVKLQFQGATLPTALTGLSLPGIVGNTVTARIKSIDLHYVQGADSMRWAPAKIVAQVIDTVADASNTHTHAATAKEMAAQINAMVAHRRPQEQDWFGEILKRPIWLQATAS